MSSLRVWCYWFWDEIVCLLWRSSFKNHCSAKFSVVSNTRIAATNQEKKNLTVTMQTLLVLYKSWDISNCWFNEQIKLNGGNSIQFYSLQYTRKERDFNVNLTQFIINLMCLQCHYSYKIFCIPWFKYLNADKLRRCVQWSSTYIIFFIYFQQLKLY